MNINKTEALDRKKLKSIIRDKSIKHAWLANTIAVSEKTLTRWISGDVTRIRTTNLNRLADALECDRELLIASFETDLYPSEKNRDVLVNELNNDNLLYELLVSSKIKLAISLIKSTFHPTLPSAIIVNFFIKLGYASLIHRKLKTAKKYFLKALQKAQNKNNKEQQFSAHLGLALSSFFDSNFAKCLEHLKLCDNNLDSAGPEKAHFNNTNALYYLYTGQIDLAIHHADACIEECFPNKPSIEKELFLSSAWQLKGAAYLFKEDSESAKTCCKNSLEVAESSGYTRCIAVSKAYLAAVEATQGNTDIATLLSDESIRLVNKKDIALPSLYCIAIFVYRIAKDYQGMEQLTQQLSAIDKGHSVTQAFSLYQQLLLESSNKACKKTEDCSIQLNKLLTVLNLNHWNNWI